jgi:formiminotetrahydrofolate cyclodeaminase
MGKQPMSADTAFKAIYDALSKQAAISFDGVVSDVEQHVLPTMAAIARGLVVIGTRLKEGIYDEEIARVEIDAQIDAMAAVLVRFANRILKEVQDIINAVLDAARVAINGALGVALL